jgi:hypothetical protein
MTLMLVEDFEEMDQEEIAEILADADRIRQERDNRELFDLYRQTATTEGSRIWQPR